MGNPQRVIPTFVWFDQIDIVYGILPHAFYISSSLGRVGRGVFVDWKAGLSPDGGTRATEEEELIRQMIQCRPSIVKHISSKKTDAIRDIPDACDIIDQLSRLRIALGSDGIWACIADRTGQEKSRDLSFQITEVLFGPI